jgi:hypothetical protein
VVIPKVKRGEGKYFCEIKMLQERIFPGIGMIVPKEKPIAQCRKKNNQCPGKDNE